MDTSGKIKGRNIKNNIIDKDTKGDK